MHERIQATSARVLDEIPHCPIVEGSSIVDVGDPVEGIVSAAERGGFDLIIMGTHGHGEFDDMLLGSTTHGVIQRSRIPVLVARRPA